MAVEYTSALSPTFYALHASKTVRLFVLNLSFSLVLTRFIVIIEHSARTRKTTSSRMCCPSTSKEDATQSPETQGQASGRSKKVSRSQATWKRRAVSRDTIEHSKQPTLQARCHYTFNPCYQQTSGRKFRCRSEGSVKSELLRERKRDTEEADEAR